MPNMNKVRESLNQPINGRIAAIIIGITAIVIPFLFLRDDDFQKLELNLITVVVPIFYALAIGGIILFVLGVHLPNVTSKNTDQKIVKTYTQIQKKLMPLRLLLFTGWLIWVLYLFWNTSAAA